MYFQTEIKQDPRKTNIGHESWRNGVRAMAAAQQTVSLCIITRHDCREMMERIEKVEFVLTNDPGSREGGALISLKVTMVGTPADDHEYAHRFSGTCPYRTYYRTDQKAWPEELFKHVQRLIARGAPKIGRNFKLAA